MNKELMVHEEIKFRLRMAGSSLSEISRELGVAQSTVTIVSQGHRTSRRIMEAISAKLDCQPVDLWPSKYPKIEEEAE